MKLIRRDPERGYLDTMLWVPKKKINVDGVKNALQYEIAERNMVRLLQLWDEAEHHLIVPRAFWKPEELEFDVVDCRPRTFARTGIDSSIILDMKPGPGGLLQPTGDDVQARAIQALLQATGGTLQLACGKGKTVVALKLAHLLQVPTIIAVDNTHLMKQWQDEIARHITVPGGVGLVQGQERDWKRGIVMATYHTLANWSATMPEEVRRWFGLIIWDEGHHVSAPTFSKSAPLFYGYRLALTATPDRPDGTHVICQHHVGDVIFKDIVQAHPPKIYFHWTGFELDFEDTQTRASVCDKNGEVHMGKMAGHLGANRHRMNEIVLPEVHKLVNDGHKVIVLSFSVDEVVNLMTLWTANNPDAPLYTDLPYPTSAEVGETLLPVKLEKDYARKCEGTVAQIKRNLATNHSIPAAKRKAFQDRLDSYLMLLQQFEVWKKTESLYRKRQRAFLAELLQKKSTGGLFTEAVSPAERMRMLKERKVIFSIMKYGREGLDDNKLSAVLVSEPISDRNTLQQIMGRPRNKKNAVLIFLEDNIGPFIGQCQKLRRHLREWPIDEGGPFTYELLNHPATVRRQGATWNAQTKTTLPTPRSLRVPGSP